MRLSARLVGAVLIALCVGVAGVSSATPQPSDQPNHAEREEAGRQADNENSQGETIWQRTVSDPVALFTFAVAAFTFVLAVSTVGLWVISIRTARRQLRAYISSIPYFEGTGIDKVPPTYTITLKNCGKTPAYSVVGWTDGVLVEHPWTEAPPKYALPISRLNIIDPGESMKLNGFYDKPLSSDDARRVFKGEIRFYFWGEVRYRDAFKKRRYVRFKYMFGGPGAVAGHGPEVCRDGNEAN